jgi:histidine triad (HIT) family protein
MGNMLGHLGLTKVAIVIFDHSHPRAYVLCDHVYVQAFFEAPGGVAVAKGVERAPDAELIEFKPELWRGYCQFSKIDLLAEVPMTTDPNCIFCKIVAGQVPSFKLYEDDETLAFLDINPVHDGHSLVIPKPHYPTVLEIAPEAFAAAARTTIKVAKAVYTTVTPDGLNLVQSNGVGAAQSVPHFHLHILPRRMNDNLLVNWTLKPGDKAHLAELAKQIRAHI